MGRGELEKIAKTYGMFAPEDAYKNGSEFPYYGSENEFTRRQFREISADKLYKRRGQRQLLQIMDGNPDSAIVYCERRLKEDPNDPETHYMLSVAYTQLNNLDNAVESMNIALQNGLPFDRFVAGPRDLMADLYETDAFKDLENKHKVLKIHGPMLGKVTDKSAGFWVRTVDEVEVIINCYESNNPDVLAATGKSISDATRDYTSVVTVDGLLPNTQYNYSVVINGIEVDKDLTFTTYAAEKYIEPFTIAFGGCAGYTPKHERMWDTLATHDLKALLLLGDNVYIDIPEHPNQIHDYTYYRRQSRPEFKNLTAKVPVYSIWDDHDAATDDIWMGPYRDKPDWKQPMVNLFKNNWNNPYYGTEEWPGCWFDFSITDVDFFMLDGRTYRTNPFMEEKTMLGPAQKEWLLNSLKESSATFKIIASPVPWDFRAKPGSNDTWNGFQDEREEIFKFIEDNKIDGVVLVSADRHRSDYWKIKRKNGYPLYDFLSSQLTNIHTHSVMDGCEFGYNQKCSFGTFTFNTSIEDPELTFQIHSIDNELIHTFSLKKSEISF